MKMAVYMIVLAVFAVGLQGCAGPRMQARMNRDPSAAFVNGPRIVKADQSYRIGFSVPAPIDAAVSVVDADGKIVRHLAAGLLGGNAPAPFQAGLAQDLAWDGKDDRGNPAPRGSTVRVALGLKPEFVRVLCEAPMGVASRGPIGMAVDAKGTLYVTQGSLFTASVTTIVTIKAFDRDGQYLRTVIPFRSDWPRDKVSMVDFITTADSRTVPLSGPCGHRPYSGFLPGHPGMTRHVPAITRDGRLFFVSRPLGRILCVGTDGSCPRDSYYGPTLPKAGATVFLALAPDEKFLYISGLGSTKTGPLHAVYRVALGVKNADVELFLGDDKAPGNDKNHFRDPRGVAVDSEGRLYVGDYMNDRIQVFNRTGSYIRSLPVPGPEQIRVHPRTGAIYVLSVRDRGKTDHYGKEVTWEIYGDKSVLKFASADDWRELARIDLPDRKRHMHDCGPIMVLDAADKEPILWIANVGRQEPSDMTWKIVDRGDKLEQAQHSIIRLNRRPSISPALAADRRNNELYAFGTPQGHLRIDPVTGKTEEMKLEGEPGAEALNKVGYAAVGPDGMLYLRSANPDRKDSNPWLIRRFGRDGKIVPFKAAGQYIGTRGRRQPGSAELCSSFSVGPDGKIYVVAMKSRLDMTARVDVYGPDGAMLENGFVPMTSCPGTVRVDSRGCLYVSDTLRPKGIEFPGIFPEDPRKHLRLWYGTVLRFPADGGSILPATRDAMTHYARRNVPTQVKGALWGYYGISPMPQQAGCLCVIADFDVDGWGRAFVPDVPGYCVAVLDGNGNVLTRFGAYGNRDASGTGSAVPEPAIPLWFPDRVTAMDGDAFVVDNHNTRVVQVRLAAAVQQDAPVPE